MPDPQIYNERELLVQIAAGSEEAFGRIFFHHRSPLFDYALKITKSVVAAEELVQDCFLKVWSNRGQMAGIENLTGYLHQIAKNAGIDYLRKLAVDARLQTQVWHNIAAQDNTTIQKVHYTEARQLINEAVGKLSPHQHRVFDLSRNQGLSYQEISVELGISVNTVRNHLVNALKIIREYLRKKYGEVTMLIILSFFEEIIKK